LSLLRQQGLRLRSVSLTAKEKICFRPESDCSPEECSFAAGYYDRLMAALELALSYDDLTRSAIETVARQHSVCPFEFSLELISWSDCVIGDYNYGFAPGVMLQRLFGDSAQRHTVIVDEAHNLVDRARDMFSARLDKGVFLRLRRRLKIEQPDIYKALGRINTWLATARRQCQNSGGHYVDGELPEDLLERLRDFLWMAEKWLIRNERSDFRPDLLTLFFECARFIKVGEIYDARFATVYETTGQDLSIKLYCINPAHLLREVWQRSRCAILFSATLAPASYYRNILGSDEQAKGINIASPFPSTNLAVFAADTISTLYRQRKTSCERVARVISTLVRQRTGNYMVFFPSYAYMEMVHRQFIRQCPDVETIVQAPDMDDNQRVCFLDRFVVRVSRTLVGFVVMGGVFGEGIDLKGERLTAAAIVGVGLPGISPERELIREHFQAQDHSGFEFAYQYPGMNRVLQAAGRVIRSNNDRGIVVLIDSRYGQHRYNHLLPVHWKIQSTGCMSDFKRQLEDFWQNKV
jgi:DNA excision repair protein ERCC-2